MCHEAGADADPAALKCSTNLAPKLKQRPAMEDRELDPSVESTSDPRPVGGLIEIGLWVYIWMGTCCVVGLGSFVYGIYEAEDLFFWMAFWIWGAALVPILFSLFFMLLSQFLRSTALVIAVLVVGTLVAAGVLLQRMDPELLRTILQNRNFIMFAIVVAFCITIAVGMYVIANVLMSFFDRNAEQESQKLAVERELDIEELEAAKVVDLRKMDMEAQIRMRELEIEHERVRIEAKKVELEYKRRDLLENDPSPPKDTP